MGELMTRKKAQESSSTITGNSGQASLAANHQQRLDDMAAKGGRVSTILGTGADQYQVKGSREGGDSAEAIKPITTKEQESFAYRRQPTATEGKSFFDVFSGRKPTTIIESSADANWPGEKELKASKDAGRTYGDPVAPFLQDGARKKTWSLPQAIQSINTRSKEWSNFDMKKLDQAGRDKIEQGWIAAQKSAIAAIGFDPRRIIETDPKGKKLTIGGMYRPKDDMVWTGDGEPSTVIHESFHRGIEKVRKAGGLKDLRYQEEDIVRGLMLRHFGGVEYDPAANVGNKQVDKARELFGRPTLTRKGSDFQQELDRIEDAAAEYARAQKPRGGPR
jgi:hypothetical protein